MSERYSSRLERIAEKIEKIQSIVAEAGSISSALEDSTMRQPAILMHLVSIAEQFAKLKEENAFELLSRFDPQDLRGCSELRNFIAHDYDGVNLIVVELVIRERLPEILKTIRTIL